MLPILNLKLLLQKQSNLRYNFYVIIFAFHLDLIFGIIIIERSFTHNLFKLTDLGYLNHEMLQYADPVTTTQLRNCAIKISKRDFKQAFSEMLATKLKFESVH